MDTRRLSCVQKETTTRHQISSTLSSTPLMLGFRVGEWVCAASLPVRRHLRAKCDANKQQKQICRRLSLLHLQRGTAQKQLQELRYFYCPFFTSFSLNFLFAAACESPFYISPGMAYFAALHI